MNLKEQLFKALDEDDSDKVVETLDELKGTYAVKYVLEYLTTPGNTHTLWSVGELLNLFKD